MLNLKRQKGRGYILQNENSKTIKTRHHNDYNDLQFNKLVFNIE